MELFLRCLVAYLCVKILLSKLGIDDDICIDSVTKLFFLPFLVNDFLIAIKWLLTVVAVSFLFVFFLVKVLWLLSLILNSSSFVVSSQPVSLAWSYSPYDIGKWPEI